jgi:hypothetical protein
VKKIAVFADVQNIYYTTRQAYGRQFDYRKLWQRLSADGEIVSAIAYATDRGDEKQHTTGQVIGASFQRVQCIPNEPAQAGQLFSWPINSSTCLSHAQRVALRSGQV